MSCTQNELQAILKGCTSLGKTTRFVYSKRKISLKEPLSEGDIANDITLQATLDALLEKGTTYVIEIVPNADNSTGAVKAELGGEEFQLSEGEWRMSFHVKTGCPYFDKFKSLTGLTGGYLYVINEDGYILGLADGNGNVNPFKVRQANTVAPKPFNDGASVPMNLFDFTMDPIQGYEMCGYLLKYYQGVLEQRLIAPDGEVILTATAGSAVTLTDTTSKLITSDFSGTTGDEVSLLLNEIEEIATPYVVASGVLTIDDIGQGTADTVKVIVSKDAPFWNEDYYGVTKTITIV